jgi:hypothetical protein
MKTNQITATKVPGKNPTMNPMLSQEQEPQNKERTKSLLADAIRGNMKNSKREFDFVGTSCDQDLIGSTD